MSTSTYVEDNQEVLEHIYTQLRWYILEEKVNMASIDPIGAMMSYTSPEDNPNYTNMVQLLQLPVSFDGPQRQINHQNYYVSKYRLTKYSLDIVENETRAGYMYILVRKVNNLAVSFIYNHDNQDIRNLSTRDSWVNWEHSGEGWIIYDGTDGHIRGNLSGSLME